MVLRSIVAFHEIKLSGFERTEISSRLQIIQKPLLFHLFKFGCTYNPVTGISPEVYLSAFKIVDENFKAFTTESQKSKDDTLYILIKACERWNKYKLHDV